MSVRQVPQGFHTITPYLIIKNAADAIAFYEKAFGATQIFRWKGDDGTVRHAEIVIGSSPVMITDEPSDYPDMKSPQSLGGSPVHLFVYVEDADTFFKTALAAGATELMPIADHPDGDRRGGLTDPFGFTWWVATQTEDISRQELQERYNAGQVM